MQGEPDAVLVQRRDSAGLVTLNRPAALNAVNAQMREALIDVLAQLNHDRAVRVVVITGAGERAFCSGQDLNETAPYTVDDVDHWLSRQHAMYQAVRDLDKPCIAAWNGVAAGAGYQIGLCSDLRVGFPEMKLGQPEIRAGLASVVGSYLMTLHLGLSQNVQMSLTGELISGQRAYELGLVNHLVPRAEVLEKSLALAADLAKLGPTAVRLTKRRLRELTQAGFDGALEAAKKAQREAYASGEPQEAMRKFLEHRKGAGR
ncbi:MAG TPA: enoyl-CoA hydratase/isomerase family protein [Burkholderiales bacterium]|nr:enoyl-CoA hydratase/isomerase family protein [Burkholderiales bacterium]